MVAYTYENGPVEQVVKQCIRDIPDFPKPGILFKDIAPLLSNADGFKQVITYFCDRYRQQHVDTIIGMESRGFLFGAPLAYELSVPFHMARKKGKLPHTTVEESYDLEYGTATIQLHTDAVRKGERALVIDDLLATGGTARATCALVEKLGGTVAECAFVIELDFLNGRDKLNDYDVSTIVRYD